MSGHFVLLCRRMLHRNLVLACVELRAFETGGLENDLGYVAVVARRSSEGASSTHSSRSSRE